MIYTLETTRFGALEVDEASLLTFAEGLLGFDDVRRFVLVPHGPDTPFAWLQSAERPDLACLLLPPFVAFPDYAPAVSPSEAGPDALLWVILRVPEGNPRDMTANLLGPLVIDEKTRQGRQLVLNDDRYSTRHRVFPAEAPAALGAAHK